MSEILSSRSVKTRTAHICFGCAREFPARAEMQREGIADNNTVFTAYLCKSCCVVQDNSDYGDGFGFGELKNDAIEYETALKGAVDHGQ